MEVFFFIGGLIALIAGAELLVRGAARIALFFGVSPLVIGLTIVAMGTSSPELAVSLQSGMKGNEGIALGNVIGSNIINILLILGLSALINPMRVAQNLVRIEVPVLITASFAVLFMSLDQNIGWLDGSILIIGFIFYIILTFVKSRNEKKKIINEYENEFGKKRNLTIRSAVLYMFYIVAGFFLLIQGSDYMVEGAVFIARTLGISEFIVSVVIIALGTSAPEAATSIVAGIHGENDIAVGNAIGSNIFNILLVLGITAIMSSGGIDVSSEIISFDIPIMVAVAVACLPIFLADPITRFRGGLFFGYYIAYIVFLIFTALEHEYLIAYNKFMLIFVIPITVITLLYMTYDGIRTNINNGKS